MSSQTNRYFRYYTYIRPLGKIPIVRNYGPQIFTLITMTVFIFFAIKPTVETILVLQKRLVDSKNVLTQVTKKSEALSLGKQNYLNLNQNLKSTIQQAVPDNPELKSVIQNLEQAAKDNQASISALQFQPLTMTPKQPNSAGSLAEISFIFNVEGNYQTLIAVLQELKRSARLISIDNLIFNKVSEDQGLVLSINGKAYYVK